MKTNKLHDYMEDHKISLLDLSRMTGIPKATIYNIKNGKLKSVKIDQVLAIMNALKIGLDYFVDQADLPTVNEPVADYKKEIKLLTDLVDTQKKVIELLSDKETDKDKPDNAYYVKWMQYLKENSLETSLKGS